jgi:exodeoxyribonuclease-5
MPAPGDKLVCLRNNKKKGLLNGGLWSVKATAVSKRNIVTMRVTPEEDLGGRTTKISVLPQFFTGDGADLPFEMRRNTDEFDYGYALTVHKSQGSQWDNVVLFDESFAFKEHASRWLYTGLTRAAEKITVVV